MASGKQSKRLRRAAQAAPPPVRAKGRGRQASPRVLLGAAALLVLVVLAVVVAFALTGGSDSSSSVPARGSLENALPGAGEVEQLLKGIPQQGDRLGSASAPATLVEYVDLQCPYCQQLETEAMPELIRRYVRTGKAKIELRPIAFVGPDSQTGRDAVIAAGRQNKLFNVAQLLYVNQGAENTGWLSDEMVRAVAASIPGLDVPRLLDDRNSSETDDEAGSYDTLANKDRIRSTPTILVGKTGRTPRLVTLASPTDGESIAAALDAALR